MGVTLYGIKNCSTVRKALAWLDDHDVAYDFHDYKKDGVDRDILGKAFVEHGWETVLNRRGMTWRKVPDDVKNNMTSESAMSLAIENPSVIKRPLLIESHKIYLGFNNEDYAKIFNKEP